MNGHAGAWRVPGYTEIRELGAGAGGRVVMARHDADGILVAIKYLAGTLLTDVGFVARFRHEARLLRMLDTPHAARLYEYVETGAGAAIVMELVDGVALRALLRSEGPTGAEAALVVLKGALLGLAAAHEAGLVHRDFKPENIMIEADGGSKLVDFGIAVRAGDGENPAGTPPYMAPEQWTGAPAGHATDVYAATVVFFECLTGTRPFRAQNIAALARQHQIVPPPIEEVPPPLQGLVERGMAKHPADRPSSVGTFLAELEAVATGAYGADWEERGRRRLSALAALLILLFPRAEETPRTETSLAETDLGRRSPLRVMGPRVAIGVGTMAAAAVVTAVLLGSGDGTAVRAGRPVPAPTPSATPLDVLPVESPYPPEETATAAPPEPTETAPAPTPTATAPPGTAAPTTTQTPTKTATAPTKSPTAKKPSATPTKKPSPTDEPEPIPGGSVLPNEPPSAPTPTATGSQTPTAVPTATVTTRPTRTPTTQPPTSPTQTPPGDETSEPPRFTASPEPDETPGAEILLVLGLVTSGAVPVTLTVKRRNAGRHRRSGGK